MKRIAIVGAGGMGNVHARHYSNIRDVQVGVFDFDGAKAAKISDTYGFTQFETLDQAFDNCVAVDICIPSDGHAALAMQAIQVGKHVFIEKPISEDLASAQAVCDLADTNGVQVMVGQVVRYFPEYRKAHEVIQKGDLGKIAAVRMRRGGAPPRSDWFLDHTRSGGVLVDLAIHEFDWLLWTLGPVDHLFAKTVGSATDKGVDYGLCTISFKSGAIAHVEATWMDPSGFRTQFEVCGSDGMIQYDSRHNHALASYSSAPARYESPMAAVDDPYFNELWAFVNCLNGGQNPIPGREGLEALRVALAARQSAKTNEVIRF